MGAVSYHRFIYFYWLSYSIEIYNRHAIACVTKTAEGVECLLFGHGKRSLASDFFVPCRLFLRRNQSSNSAFTTTVVEDTHLTLAAIPFKVEANNSLIFLLLQTYEKKFAAHSFLLIL